MSSHSILHSSDGTALYINRYLEPAWFSGNEANEDIDARSKKYGASSRIIPMPQQSSVPNGMIVTWGKVVLEPLDTANVSELAAGHDIHVGLMIDHIGNFQRSAQQGLPIYRLTGGAGYVWAASWDQSGKGTLRFLAIDASATSPQISVASTGGAETERVQEELRNTKAEAEKAKTELKLAQEETERAKADAIRARNETQQVKNTQTATAGKIPAQNAIGATPETAKETQKVAQAKSFAQVNPTTQTVDTPKESAGSVITNYLNSKGGCAFSQTNWIYSMAGPPFGKELVDWTTEDFNKVREWVKECYYGAQPYRLQEAEAAIARYEAAAHELRAERDLAAEKQEHERADIAAATSRLDKDLAQQ